MIQTSITNIGDPFVMLYEGTYYLYATSSPDGFYVWTSTNLNDWDKHDLCYKKTEDSYGYMDFWAPEVVYRNGVFVMHYTSKSKKNGRLLPGVAVSKSPLGPFEDAVKGEPMFDFGYAVIDGHAFTDDDGKSYFFYTKDVSTNIINGVHTSELYYIRLSDDFLRVEGEPVFVTTPDQEWETSLFADWRWNEGPFVIKKDGKYYLTYSANCFDNKLYGVGYAVADKIEGPYVKSQSNPVLQYREKVFSGPGHNCLFTDKNGDLKAAFHIHTEYEKATGDRRACICDVIIKDGDLEFCV